MKKDDDAQLNNEERKELEFYRSFISSMNGMMYTLSLIPFKVKWVTDNDALKRTLNIKVSDIIKKDMDGIEGLLNSNPDFQESVINYRNEFFKNPDMNWAGVFRIKDIDDIYQWIIYSAATLEKDEEGNPDIMAAIAIPLKNIFNTPKTLKELNKYLSRKIYKEVYDQLSPRQLEVLELTAKGKTVKEIAEKLSISPYTVKDHCEALFTKLSCNTKAELVVIAERIGVVSPPFPI